VRLLGLSLCVDVAEVAGLKAARPVTTNDGERAAAIVPVSSNAQRNAKWTQQQQHVR
jgi:hypothetical protein